ncbi:MAG: hypothetical protein ACFCU3_11125 [Verrucomicrobiales bacterium]
MISKLLIIGAAILGLGAAGLGYLNQQALEAAKNQVATTTSQLTAKQAELAQAVEETTQAKTALEEANSARAAAENTLSQKEAQLSSAQSEASSLKDEITSKDNQITELQARIDELSGAGDETEMPGVAGPSAQESEELKAQVAELEEVRNSLTSRLETAENRSKALEEAEALRQQGLARPGLEGRILAVNQAWNFVVLNIGDRQGVVENSELIIRRGGSNVGKVRVTSVEPAQSIADIMLDSVPRGLIVEPGDVVIFSNEELAN